ncbi:MAG: PAS domain S-box protein [Desulfobulbaceae bacterium]|nr:PAS domain S-box protein [Desulfobulbaceae bacterium]
MIIPWTPVIAIDIAGSVVTFVLAVWCAVLAREWTLKKPNDIFRHYIFLLTLAIVFFAVSRSVGHLLKQLLLLCHQSLLWKQISPFSGAINSTTFVVIFAFGIYFHRFQKVHFEVERYRNNLEGMIAKRTTELEEINIRLSEEIAERKHVEYSLKESKGYLQAILDNTTLPMYLKDVEGNYILINREYERLARISNAEIIGKNDFDVFPGAIAALFQFQDNEVKAKNTPIEFEETILLHDGEHTFLTSKFPLRDNDIIYAVGGVCTDITQRKLAEEKLAAEQERLAVTLRSIGDGVITTDVSGQIVLINKVAEDLTGWSQEEAVGRPFDEVFQLLTKNREHYPNPVTTALNSGQIFSLEEQTILVNKHGGELLIADSGAPIRDTGSNTIGVVIVFRDISRQSRLEEENLKAKKLESVGVLAGGIAHDFNNILAAILGNINLARLDTSIHEQTQHLLLAAEKASLRAKDLTQQLLTFSKGGEPVKKTASLQEVVKDSADFVLHGKNVVVRYTFPDDLWLVDIDKGQISQVIQNIVINADHAMPDGGMISIVCENIEGNAEPELSLTGKYVAIAITDTGVGIAPDVIEKMFDPYFSTKSTGSGLGLAICHSIIRKHHGHITATSTPGEGTTFTITLPASNNPLTRPEKLPLETQAGQQAKILFMDDEEIVRNVAKSMLNYLGHEVILASDGAEAIRLFSDELASTSPFDLTIMDLTVPGGMGGEEAVKEILSRSPQAKVIVSSGYSNDPIMAKYQHYGFCAAIVKPYQLDELGRVTGEVLCSPPLNS